MRILCNIHIVNMTFNFASERILFTSGIYNVRERAQTKLLTLRKLGECITDPSWNAKGVSEMAFLPQGSPRGETRRVATQRLPTRILSPRLGKRPEIWLDESGSKLVFIRVSREIFNESRGNNEGKCGVHRTTCCSVA